MSSNTNGHMESETDINLNKILKAKPKLKNSIEKQDSESLNTMDYYREDSSNKNSLIDEAKTNNQLLYNPNNSKEKKSKPEDIEVKKDLSFQLNQLNKNINTNITNKNSNSNSNPNKINLNINVKKIHNIQKTINDVHYICSNCNLNTGSLSKHCIKCNNYYCAQCFKGIIKDISENKQEKEIKNKTEKICQFCWIKMKNRNNFMSKNLEPLDSLSDDEMRNMMMEKSKTNRKNKSEGKMKSLKEQFNIYEELLNKINDSKNEIEIKKNICMNILQMMKKAVEIEYNKNLNKLNELSIKLNKIKEDINKKINNSENKYKNEVELQINIDTFKNTLNGFSKIFDNINQKMISRLFFRGYKLYESDYILINHSDIYFMQKKELFPELPLWNAFLKIERYTNNFINYLNFNIDIRPKNKTISEPSNNTCYQSEWNNKSRFMVNLIVNNKFIRLNKKTKDNNYINSSYESSEEEKKLLFSKGNYKIKDFNVKVIVSEIML